MATLFQIHASIDTLKSRVRELAPLWHDNDAILLLGESAIYIDWFNAYINEFNSDDELEQSINNIRSIYALKADINSLNDQAKQSFDTTKLKVIDDSEWVALTQDFMRVITLS